MEHTCFRSCAHNGGYKGMKLKISQLSQLIFKKLLSIGFGSCTCSIMAEGGDRMGTSSLLNDSQLSQLSQMTENGSLEKSTENKFIDHEWGMNLLHGFSKLYKDTEFVDITLVINKREFLCHRSILAISSPFFMALFSTAMSESKQNKIELKEIDYLTMELILDYIYTGEVLLSEETVQDLLSAANRFQLLPLRSGCADFMRKHITVSNCIGVYFFAKCHECEVLAVKAKEIINKQVSQLCQQQEFLSLPADKLIEIISDDNIEVTHEEIVYEACLNWVKADLDSRRGNLVQVMECVRFANINSYYFCDRIDNNSLLKECEDLKRKLDEVKYFHMLCDRHGEMDLNLLPRLGMQHERVVMIMANPYTEDSLKKYNSVEVLLPKTGEVIFLCKLPQSLYTPGCAITGDNQIYLAGGSIRKINYRGSISIEGVSNTFYVFDHASLTWVAKARMNIGRSMFNLTIVDGFAYAVGGTDGTDVLACVERYDPWANTWTFVAPLPQALKLTTSVSFRGKLFVFGGENADNIVNTAYRYDPTLDIWTQLTPMNTGRVLAGSVVHKGKIYVVGGNGQVSDKWKREQLPEFCVSSVEIYDPDSNSWSIGPELPNALCGAGVVKFGDTILIVGGEDDKSWMAGLCWLKEEKGRQLWVEGQELPTVMSTFGCTVANIQRETLKQQA
ncbi:kelch-like protein 12 isoform X2 [Dreissena polymorpha]|uniref:kelch-like protein 12 isoform X2 n=1 Tax=Dreissena polymorpha TaxID=45954 RepID=UPI0022647A90|nr:kelch-like protein 12 isoform X2 [Dreissena polymorpha]XP_052256296.1 kelch-like protein 12 isoform X2 [Dreissena polymorpha]